LYVGLIVQKWGQSHMVLSSIAANLRLIWLQLAVQFLMVVCVGLETTLMSCANGILFIAPPVVILMV